MKAGTFQPRRLKYLATINDEALTEETDPDYELQYVDIGNVAPFPIGYRPSQPKSAAEPLACVKVPSRSPGGSTLTHAKNLRHEAAATDGSDGKGLCPDLLHLEYESGGK